MQKKVIKENISKANMPRAGFFCKIYLRARSRFTNWFAIVLLFCAGFQQQNSKQLLSVLSSVQMLFIQREISVWSLPDDTIHIVFAMLPFCFFKLVYFNWDSICADCQLFLFFGLYFFRLFNFSDFCLRANLLSMASTEQQMN